MSPRNEREMKWHFLCMTGQWKWKSSYSGLECWICCAKVMFVGENYGVSLMILHSAYHQAAPTKTVWKMAWHTCIFKSNGNQHAPIVGTLHQKNHWYVTGYDWSSSTICLCHFWVSCFTLQCDQEYLSFEDKFPEVKFKLVIGNKRYTLMDEVFCKQIHHFLIIWFSS
jgi:hypothetical protein